MIMFDRGDYWQCAYVIPKGGIERMKAEGLEAFHKRVVEMSPFLSDRVGELKTWDDVKLLSVTVDRLRKWWRPGLICIGDAAHAMSPIGGVGINMAVQDAVAAANRLAGPLRAGKVTDEDLQAIEERRTPPMRFTQRLQLTIQQRIISRVLASHERPKPPIVLQALRRLSDSAPHSGAADRDRHSPRARANARSGAGFGREPHGVPSARERLGVDAERVARHALNRVGFSDLRPRPAPHGLARRGAERKRSMDRLPRGRFADPCFGSAKLVEGLPPRLASLGRRIRLAASDLPDERDPMKKLASKPAEAAAPETRAGQGHALLSRRRHDCPSTAPGRRIAARRRRLGGHDRRHPVG